MTAGRGKLACAGDVTKSRAGLDIPSVKTSRFIEPAILLVCWYKYRTLAQQEKIAWSSLL
jgi:hypothetical protein